MKIMKQLLCPISKERINERVTRLNALIGIIITISGFVFSSSLFFIFLAADFYIRAFTKTKYSPISYLSSRMVDAFNLEEKRIDKAPKIFAARIGFLFTSVISILLLLNISSAAMIVGGVFVFFASLEFALAICMGCLMYTYLVLPFYRLLQK
jgi:hypothetical protein